ncbi:MULTISPECIES: WD40 repeat domain-containing protein [unclassified Meiothermus]|uniref:WD40 repeat domain-containing protein n=1 Tax=unclassified Meiothermus TaxID=370471 RepID=UPI00131405F6|nr:MULTISPECIES: WD40 repeat domain-containing protein [unclassified Meiothermus]
MSRRYLWAALLWGFGALAQGGTSLEIRCLFQGASLEAAPILLNGIQVGTCPQVTLPMPSGKSKISIRASQNDGTFLQYERSFQGPIPSPLEATLERFDPRVTLSLNTKAPGLYDSAIAPDNRWLAVGGSDGLLRLWDLGAAREVRVFKGHTKYIRSVAYSPDGKWIASGSGDATVRLWDAVSGKELKNFKLAKSVWAVTFDTSGKHLLVIQLGGEAMLLDVASGKPLKRWQTSSFLFSTAFSPSGRTLVVGRSNGGVEFWDLANTRLVNQLQLGGGPVYAMAFSPDSRFLAAGRDSGEVMIYDLLTPGGAQLVATLTGHTDAVSSLAYSPDGRWLASGSADRTVRLWELAPGEAPRLNRVWVGHTATLNSVYFRKNLLYTTSNSGNILIWALPQ